MHYLCETIEPGPGLLGCIFEHAAQNSLIFSTWRSVELYGPGRSYYLKSPEATPRAGSSPAPGTRPNLLGERRLCAIGGP